MLNPLEFARFLKEHIGIFAGVPDSLLKPLNSALNEVVDSKDFYTTANEGQAIAFVSAYYLATRNLGLVYMQNSGLGNAINPLLSLADEKVYGIPLIMFIGLRGGENDEPQHKKQGLVTKAILDACGIENFILEKEIVSAKKQLLESFKRAKRDCKIVAVLVERDTFEICKTSQKVVQSESDFLREEAISIIQDGFLDAKFVSTTGMISREHYELREKKGITHDNDFLVIGSMGYASSIAYIFSKFTENRVVCLDGDGAFIMHMGCVASFCDSSFVHIVLNNFAHDSVGGQMTNAKNLDFLEIAKASGYKNVYRVKNAKELENVLSKIQKNRELSFVEVVVKKGARKDLGRPKDMGKLKQKFMDFFKGN